MVVARFKRALDAYVRAVNLVMRGLGIALTALLGALFVLALFMVVIAVPAAVLFAMIKSFPDEVAQKQDGSWLDLIFEERYIIFAARIVLLSLAVVLLIGGIYIACSIGVRMRRKEWLKRAGGFEAAVAERAADVVETSDEAYATVVAQLMDENDDLTNRLEVALERLEDIDDDNNPPSPLGSSG